MSTESYNVCPVILAAGRGKRMESNDLPKPLSIVGGIPIIDRILESLGQSVVRSKPLLVVGFNKEAIIKHLGNRAEYVVQEQLLGTGHAVRVASEHIGDKFENILVLNGDHPFIPASVIDGIVSTHIENDAAVTITTSVAADFNNSNEHLYSYGRVLRNGDLISGIIEVKDASEEEKNLKEVNIGYYCFNTKWLMENVGKLENSNFQKEFYITDLVKIAVEAGEKVSSFSVDGVAGMGVNTKEQLEKADTFAKNL